MMTTRTGMRRKRAEEEGGEEVEGEEEGEVEAEAGDLGMAMTSALEV